MALFLFADLQRSLEETNKKIRRDEFSAGRAHFAERTSADNRYDYKAEMLVAWSKWAKHVAGLSEGRRND